MGGGIEVSVAQHTNGFQTLANNGTYQERYMIEKITDRSSKVIYQHKVAQQHLHHRPGKRQPDTTRQFDDM